MMQSAISREVSIGILLVPHRITTFFTDGGTGKLMVSHRTFSTRSPLMPKFNAFIAAKYLFHSLEYLLSLLIEEHKVLHLYHRIMVIMIFNPVRFIKIFCWN